MSFHSIALRKPHHRQARKLAGAAGVSLQNFLSRLVTLYLPRVDLSDAEAAQPTDVDGSTGKLTHTTVRLSASAYDALTDHAEDLAGDTGRQLKAATLGALVEIYGEVLVEQLTTPVPAPARAVGA